MSHRKESIIYLTLKDEIIGIGALRRIRKNISEIKLMYIRPAYRRKGYGKALLDNLLKKAKEYGYHTVYLDSPPFLTIAHHFYHTHGFIDLEEYPETEVPPQLRSKWLFMEKTLRNTTP
ncbi:MAG: hypothetical protein QG670_767 [Thermoproteota archaeon]|nr:hypothetical protein [Thermoproteota archaeon]